MKETDNIFPSAGYDVHVDETRIYGLEARDYIAVQAMTGLLANPQLTNGAFEQIAKWAYRQADAMLKESEKCTRGSDEQS